MDEHLEHCAECRREAFYFSEISSLAGRLESAPARPDFNLRLRAAIERQESAEAAPRPWYRIQLAPAWRPVMAAVAVVFIFVLTYGGYQVINAPTDRDTFAESTFNQRWSTDDVMADADDFTVPPGMTLVESDSPDAERVRNLYLTASERPSDYILGTVGLDDPTAKKREPQYVMPVITSEQMVRKVSY